MFSTQYFKSTSGYIFQNMIVVFFFKKKTTFWKQYFSCKRKLPAGSAALITLNHMLRWVGGGIKPWGRLGLRGSWLEASTLHNSVSHHWALEMFWGSDFEFVVSPRLHAALLSIRGGVPRNPAHSAERTVTSCSPCTVCLSDWTTWVWKRRNRIPV